MNQVRAGLVLVLLTLGGCAKRISYPPTEGGAALRNFYEGPVDDDSRRSIFSIQTRAEREQLEPAMLAILRRDDSLRAIEVASVLSDWDPHVATTAPEFRRLLPAIARGLEVPPTQENAKRLTSLGSVVLLSRMGREAAYPLRQMLYQAFNAPVASPIEGESLECWNRFYLSGLLTVIGADAVPALLEGTHHSDKWVRECAANAIVTMATADEGTFASYPEGLQPTASERVAGRVAARAALPRAREVLKDTNSSYREAADRELARMAATRPSTVPE